MRRTLEEAKRDPKREETRHRIVVRGRDAEVGQWEAFDLWLCWCGGDGVHAADYAVERRCDACQLAVERKTLEETRANLVRLLMVTLSPEEQNRFLTFGAATDLAIANIERMRKAGAAKADPREQGRGIVGRTEPTTCDVGADWED